MKKRLYLENKYIEYNLIRKNVKNINLRIKSDKDIFVSANINVPEIDIETFIISKSEFIFRTLAYYDEYKHFNLSPRNFIDGESFYILGHERRLKIFSGEKNKINDDGQFLYLTVKDPTNIILKKRIFERWQKKLCQETMYHMCRNIFTKFEKYGVQFPEIKIRKMKSRYGSCQIKKNTVTLNQLLIEYPVSCIEYVITHEFTHLLQPNHSKDFYKLLTVFMPDWADRKKSMTRHYISSLI